MQYVHTESIGFRGRRAARCVANGEISPARRSSVKATFSTWHRRDGTAASSADHAPSGWSSRSASASDHAWNGQPVGWCGGCHRRSRAGDRSWRAGCGRAADRGGGCGPRGGRRGCLPADAACSTPSSPAMKPSGRRCRCTTPGPGGSVGRAPPRRVGPRLIRAISQREASRSHHPPVGGGDGSPSHAVARARVLAFSGTSARKLVW
jgi:hypothetical protein